MGRSAILTVKILADASQAAKEMDTASGKMGKFQSGISKAAVPAAIVGAGMLAFGKAAGEAASEAEQAMGAVDAVFGKTAKSVHKFAKTSADSVGLSSREYEAMAASFGAQLRNMGVAANQLAPKTNDLVALGADLAAQFGGSTAEAVEALGSLLRGETDPIEKYGAGMKQSEIAAKKLELGLVGLTGEQDKAATTQATLALLTERTATAHGAFAREADTAAGAQQRANAKWEDAKATLGVALLPVMGELATAFGGVSDVATEHVGVVQAVIGAIGALVIGVLAINAALKLYKAAQVAVKAVTVIWTGVQWALNAALSANPIGLVILAIAALVIAFGIAWAKSERFREIVTDAFDAVKGAAQTALAWIRDHWPLILAIVTGPFGLAVLAIAKHWDAITDGAQAVIGWFRSAWDAIRAILVAPFTAAWNVISPIIEKIKDAVGAVTSAIGKIPKLPSLPHIPGVSAAPATAAVMGADRRGVARTGASAPAQGVSITIQGALDPEGVARQIRAILSGHDVRLGHAAMVGRTV